MELNNENAIEILNFVQYEFSRRELNFAAYKYYKRTEEFWWHSHSRRGKMSLCLPRKCMEELGYTPVRLKSTAYWNGQHHVPTALPQQKVPWIKSWVFLSFRQPSERELTRMKHVYTNAVTTNKQTKLISFCCILYTIFLWINTLSLKSIWANRKSCCT